MKTLIFAPCTGKKALKAPPSLKACNLIRESLEEVASKWNNAVEVQSKELSSTEQKSVKDMYTGRAWPYAVSASNQVSGELYVISAGLGFVHANQEIPPYDLTVANSGPKSGSGKEDNRIKSKIMDRKFKNSDWWSAIGKHSNCQTDLLEVISLENSDLILIALTIPYSEMISDQLASLPNDVVKQVRIFGNDFEEKVPPIVQNCVMPYGDRFKNLPSRDKLNNFIFATKALEHYCEKLSRNDGTFGISIDEDKQQIEREIMRYN